MTTPKPTRGSVGPGTLDQELQEHKGLLQNRIASKGPSDFQGNQKAKVAAAKGPLPHKDHRGPGATRAPAAGATRGSSQKVQGLLEPQGLQQPQGTNRRPPEDQGTKDNSPGLLPTRWGLGPKTRCPRTPRARSRDYARRVTSPVPSNCVPAGAASKPVRSKHSLIIKGCTDVPNREERRTARRPEGLGRVLCVRPTSKR